MDKDLFSGGVGAAATGESHSQINQQKEAGMNPLRRDNDSLDDFEHLEHHHDDAAKPATSSSVAGASDSSCFTQKPHEDEAAHLINTVAADALLLNTGNEHFNAAKDQITTTTTNNSAKTMSSIGDLLGMEEDFKTLDSNKKPPTSTATTDLLGDFTTYTPPPVPAHSDDFTKGFGDFDHFKAATQNFMDTERDEFTIQAPQHQNDFADRFSDSEPENEPEHEDDDDDDIHSSSEDIKMSSKDDDFHYQKADYKQPEIFKDVIEEPENEPEAEPQPEVPQRDYFDKEPSPVKEFKTEPVKTTPEPVPEPVVRPKTPETVNKPIVAPACKLPQKQPTKQEVMGAEAMFCKMGLDAWFNPERLNPKVESLIYWRDPKKSGIVFGGTLVVLLSLAYFSFISVSAYLSLLALAGTISFRIYKNVLQAVQKTSDGHPFKEQLEADITLPQDKVRQITDIAVTHMNAAVAELRRLFLVEDLVDSIKFGVLLWCLTYLGAWFNGMTLIIIAFVALFTLPKVYENNKSQIDANLDIVRTKVAEITSKVKAAIPIGKKSDEKKE